MWCVFFFFKQKTAYEMRISDWSSDVCSSDLLAVYVNRGHALRALSDFGVEDAGLREILQRVGLGRHWRNPGFKFSAEEFQRGMQRFHRTRPMRAERAPWPEQLGQMFELDEITGEIGRAAHRERVLPYC